MNIMEFKALVSYQELCPEEPEREVSRGEVLDFNSFGDLTKKISTHPQLGVHPRILFKAIEGSDLIPGGPTDGEIIREVSEGNRKYVLKIKVSLQKIKWENLS